MIMLSITPSHSPMRTASPSWIGSPVGVGGLTLHANVPAHRSRGRDSRAETIASSQGSLRPAGCTMGALWFWFLQLNVAARPPTSISRAGRKRTRCLSLSAILNFVEKLLAKPFGSGLVPHWGGCQLALRDRQKAVIHSSLRRIAAPASGPSVASISPRSNALRRRSASCPHRCIRSGSSSSRAWRSLSAPGPQSSAWANSRKIFEAFRAPAPACGQEHFGRGPLQRKVHFPLRRPKSEILCRYYRRCRWQVITPGRFRVRLGEYEN